MGRPQNGASFLDGATLTWTSLGCRLRLESRQPSLTPHSSLADHTHSLTYNGSFRDFKLQQPWKKGLLTIFHTYNC